MTLRIPTALLAPLVAGALVACASDSRPLDRPAEGEASLVRTPGSAGELTPGPQASPDPSPGDGPTPEPGPGPMGASDCTNEEAAVAGARKRSTSGRLRGDVDGDGRTELVWLAVDRRAQYGCQLFLAVESGTDLVSLPIEQAELNLALSPPSLISLAPVDPEPGSEIVVDLFAGASTRFVGLFGLRGGDLARIAFNGPGTLPRNLFAYGGSVAHLDGVDCARPQGIVVVTSATPRGNRYVVHRRYYRVRHGGSTPLPHRTERRIVEPNELGGFSELASPPFAGCL